MNKKQSKLVRDLIVAIITESGRDCSWRYVGSREEHMNLLIDKLDEESYELMCAETHRERVEEAGDLFEVFKCLIDLNGISLEEAQNAAKLKAASRGSFKSGIVLERCVKST